MVLIAAVLGAACGGRDSQPTRSPTTPSSFETPPPTPRLSGRVTSAATGGPLLLAVVWLTYQSGPNDVVRTDQDGRYVDAGVSGPVDLRIELEGFEPQTRRTTVGPETTEDFALIATRAPTVSTTGEWASTFLLAPRCRSVLPAVAHDRSYDATIQQEDAQVVITFRSPSLETWPKGTNGFVALGSIVEKTLSFTIPADTLWEGVLYGEFVDHLTEAEHLTVGLGGTGDVRANEVTVTMNGGAQYDAGGHPGNAYCEAPDHRFVFRRR